MNVSDLGQGLALHLRYAFRAMARNPGFAAAATLTLAVGLASATVMFSVVNTVLLRPLPFHDSQRILCISRTIPFFGPGRQPVTLDEYLRWRKTGLFNHIAALTTEEFTLLGAGTPERVAGMGVTPDFFRVFDMRPAIGRDFRADDNAGNAKPVVMLSHELWAGKFHSDPDIIGKAIHLGDDLRVVVGVMPRGFEFPRHADIAAAMDWAPQETEFWIPLQFTEKEVQEHNFNYLVLARLAPGVSRIRVKEELQAITHQVFEKMAKAQPQFADLIREQLPLITVNAEPLQQTITSEVGLAIWILFAAVGVLVLLVYANVASLFLTRNAGRMREFAIRQALGASDWQIFRQTLIESGVFTAFAAGLGLLVALWCIGAARMLGGSRVPRLYELSLDYRVVLWLVLLAIVASVLFGAVPWLVRMRTQFAARMQEQGRTATGGRAEQRLRRSLVSGEIALTVVLLVSAALLVASLRHVFESNPGFDPTHLLTADIGLGWNRFPDRQRRYQHFEQLLSALRQLPDVESAGMASGVPLTREVDIHTLTAIGSLAGTSIHAELRGADPEYLRTMRIPLVRGRWFRESDGETVAVISDNLARRFWPGWDPIGRQFRDGDNTPLTVIGVVGPVRNAALDREPTFQFYRPAAVDEERQMDFFVRTRTPPAGAIPEMVQAIHQIDPEQPVAHTRTMEQVIAVTTLPRRFETLLLGSFAAAALFLSALGVFGVLSLSVTRRRRELGIRLALGATTDALSRLVLGEGMKLLLLGGAAGLALSIFSERFLRSLIYGVSTSDPLAYAATVAVLAASALLACWIPARRAARADPADVLRDE